MSDPLVADELKSSLDSAIIGREVIVLEQTSSTNDAISRLAPLDANDGLVLFAEHQTAGRGQRGNRWESAAGKGLWFSILLRPQIEIRDSGRLTVWAIEGIADVIRAEFGLQPAIKLPNDVQIYGRKVAGVLVEMRAQQRAPHLAIVGIGINVNQSAEDFPAELHAKAISLAMALGERVDRRQFAIALLEYFDRTYRQRFSEASLSEPGGLKP
jgi:BirA family transcriptional regulator, biotin operon repressor / biotin---[acetyl-CoA-carboxylase] ligase